MTPTTTPQPDLTAAAGPADALEADRIAALYPRVQDPGTGRTAHQLTSGPEFCQALYYFIPSLSPDGSWLVYQRYKVTNDEIDEVWWEALEIATGKRRRLAHALAGPAFPHPGACTVFNAARNEFIYLTGHEYRAVHIATGEDRLLFTVPEGRSIRAQNCASPCGRYFFYISHNSAELAKIEGRERQARREITDTQLVRYDLDTGEHHLVVRLNAYSKHVIPYGDKHLVFSYDHLPVEHMLLFTDYEGGWYTALRSPNRPDSRTCHYGATRRGIQYELQDNQGHQAGVLCPHTHRRVEFSAPALKSKHVAAAPGGNHWMTEGAVEEGRVLYTLRELPRQGEPVWDHICGPWPTYGTGQKSHGHPYVTPCGRWVLMLGGDPKTQSNHLFLLDIRDVPPAKGLPDFSAEVGDPRPA